MNKKDLAIINQNLTIIHKSCQEALDGIWDKSDDGFEAMQWLIEETQELLKKS